MNFPKVTAFIFVLLASTGVLLPAQQFVITPKINCDGIFVINWANEPIDCTIKQQVCKKLQQDEICYLPLSLQAARRTNVLAVIFAYDHHHVLHAFFHKEITCAGVLEYQIAKLTAPYGGVASDEERRIIPGLLRATTGFKQMEAFLQGGRTADPSMSWFNKLVIPIIQKNFELTAEDDTGFVVFKPLYEGTDEQQCFLLGEEIEAVAAASEDAADE